MGPRGVRGRCVSVRGSSTCPVYWKCGGRAVPSVVNDSGFTFPSETSVRTEVGSPSWGHHRCRNGPSQSRSVTPVTKCMATPESESSRSTMVPHRGASHSSMSLYPKQEFLIEWSLTPVVWTREDEPFSGTTYEVQSRRPG